MKKRFRSLLALGVLAPAALVAQQEPVSKDTGSTSMPTPAPVDFSGVAFGNFHYNGGQTGGSSNSFGLDRAYLTFKMPAGDRASVRVTADIFDNGSNGLDYRLKYGYLNYNFYRSEGGFKVDGRAGMIQTPVIDQVENFWPRYISPTPLDRTSLMSSADLGVATFIGLPSKMGELYLGVLNGPGYTTPSDNDRFKDYTARLTLTPFSSSDMWLLQNMTLLGYYYKGTVDGNISGENVGMKKDRYGAFLGLKDPRFTFGAEWDQAKNGLQTAATAAPGYTESDVNGRLWSVFGTAKPFQMMDPNGLPLGIVLRYDYAKPNTDVDGTSRYFVGGLTWDLTKRVQFAVDYQEQIPHDGLAALNGFNGTLAAPAHTWFAHWVANF